LDSTSWYRAASSSPAASMAISFRAVEDALEDALEDATEQPAGRAVWHRFLLARKPPQACRLETLTSSVVPARVWPSLLPREPLEPLRARPACSVPALHPGARRLLGRLTVEVVEGARRDAGGGGGSDRPLGARRRRRWRRCGQWERCWRRWWESKRDGQQPHHHQAG
jgi:hypothetical protein